MKTLVWVLLGWLGMIVCSSFGARLNFEHVIPDIPLVVGVFLAMRREPIAMSLGVFVLGYLVGRCTGAPTGLYEVTFVMSGMLVYRMTGRVGGETAFFAGLCGVALLFQQMVLCGLLFLSRDNAGWPLTTLVWSSLSTAVVAAILHRPMLAFERRLNPVRRGGLLWH